MPFDDRTVTSLFNHRSQCLFQAGCLTVLVSSRQVSIFEMSIVLEKTKEKAHVLATHIKDMVKGLLDSEHNLNGTGMRLCELVYFSRNSNIL